MVTGTVITTIGLSLMPVAAGWAMGGDAEAADYGSVRNILITVATLAIVLILSRIPVAMISRLSILLAIVIGTLGCLALGWADFSHVLDRGVFAIPEPFAFGMPSFSAAAIISMFIVVIVTFAETTADIIAVGEIVRTKVDSKRIASGLRADMLSSAVSPIFNSFTQSAFAQNVGLVAITGVKSRFVVTAGGAILVVLGLHLAGWIDLAVLSRSLRLPIRPRLDTAPSAPRSFVLGLAFAAGWTPCIGPILAAVIGLATTTGSVGQGIVLLLAYSLGLGVPFVLVAIGADAVARRLSWLRTHQRVVSIVSGGFLITVGFLMITDRFERLAALVPAFGL